MVASGALSEKQTKLGEKMNKSSNHFISADLADAPANEFSEGVHLLGAGHQTMRLRFRQFDKEKMWQIVAKNAVKGVPDRRGQKRPLPPVSAESKRAEK
jgi:hypothetical protein